MRHLNHTFSVAPMMDWTDRHCRVFHRLLTRRALLYTEMITAEAVIHGRRERLLAKSPAEDPVALQLGGAVPHRLAEAAAIGEAMGYAEINLNVGCPSDRVQEGRFGAASWPVAKPGKHARLEKSGVLRGACEEVSMSDVTYELPRPLVTVSPDWLGGEPSFTGRRVAVKALFDYVKTGHTLEQFLADYPSVSREHAVAVIELANRAVLQTNAAE